RFGANRLQRARARQLAVVTEGADVLFASCVLYHGDPPSFPTRRSSDLFLRDRKHTGSEMIVFLQLRRQRAGKLGTCHGQDDVDLDRKSTRLNSSHSQISYAVFCLKKENGEPDPLLYQSD